MKPEKRKADLEDGIEKLVTLIRVLASTEGNPLDAIYLACCSVKRMTELSFRDDRRFHYIELENEAEQVSKQITAGRPLPPRI